MKCIIVGLGYFGKIIKSKLNDHEVLTVDPFNTASDYKDISDIDFVDGKWFVTTPASTHHDVLLKLFDKGVKDIWVEKPICSTLDDTLDIFSKKPDDVFLYCDFTWLQHASIKKLGDVENVKHIEMKWLNDGSMIPKDVTIVTDLAIHPISILSFFLIKFKDVIDNIQVVYANNTSVLINGQSKGGVTFNIEVSNSSKKKMRSISIYSTDTVYRWNSDNEFFIENVGDVQRTDAIEENIKHFFSKNSIGYPLDIARSLENVNELFSSFGH